MRIRIEYPSDFQKYIDMTEGYTIYDERTREYALKNCYKQVLRHGFESFEDFHRYFSRVKDEGHKHHLIDMISKKSGYVFFNSLMRAMDTMDKN